MNDVRRLLWLGTGLLLGAVGTALWLGHEPRAAAGNNDRYDDYILCTGTVDTNRRTPTDGVWLLDYRAGTLLGTVIDRTAGKIIGWAELDLPTEFGIPPKQNVHFLMTTGTIAQGQAALYVAETNSGKFGVYTLGPDPNTGQGMIIRRHDLTTFRKKPA